MHFETIRIDVEDGLAHCVLNAPEKGNPLDAIFCPEFGQAANELATRSDIRAILLRAEGRFFSVGGGIELFSRHLYAASSEALKGTYVLYMGITRLLDEDLLFENATAMAEIL